MGNCESREDASKRAAPPAMPAVALLIEAFVAPTSLADPNAQPFVAVNLDGKPASRVGSHSKLKESGSSMLLPIPSGALELPARQGDAQLQIRLFLKTFAQMADGRQSEGQLKPAAELSVPLSDFVRYGAPLYCSLWLGLNDSVQTIDDDVQSALRRARNPGVPKIKITLFRPSVPFQLLREPSSGVSSCEPNVKAFARGDWWEPEAEGAETAHVSQIEGLIRCLEESQALVHAHEREQEKTSATMQNFHDLLQTMDSKRMGRQTSGTESKLKNNGADPSTPVSGSSEKKGSKLRPRAKEQQNPLAKSTGLMKGQLDRLHDAVLKRRAAVGASDGPSSPSKDTSGVKSSPRKDGWQLPPDHKLGANRLEQLEKKCQLLEARMDAERLVSSQRGTAYLEQINHKTREAANASEQVERLVGEVATLRKSLSEVTTLRRVIKQVDGKALESEPEEHAPVHVLPEDAVNWLKELEKVELALVEERQRSGALLEERQTLEVAHQRDVAALEEMLQVMLEELAEERAKKETALTSKRLPAPASRFSVIAEPASPTFDGHEASIGTVSPADTPGASLNTLAYDDGSPYYSAPVSQPADGRYYVTSSGSLTGVSPGFGSLTGLTPTSVPSLSRQASPRGNPTSSPAQAHRNFAAPGIPVAAQIQHAAATVLGTSKPGTTQPLRPPATADDRFQTRRPMPNLGAAYSQSGGAYNR